MKVKPIVGCRMILLVAALAIAGCETSETGGLPYALSAPGAVLDLSGWNPAPPEAAGVNRRASLGSFLDLAASLRVRVREESDPVTVVEEFSLEEVTEDRELVLSGLPPGPGVLVVVELLDVAGEVLLSARGLVDLVPGEVAVFVPQPELPGDPPLFFAAFEPPALLTDDFNACEVIGGSTPPLIAAVGVGGSQGVDLGGSISSIGAVTTQQQFPVAQGDGEATCFEAAIRAGDSAKVFFALVDPGACFDTVSPGSITSGRQAGIEAIGGRFSTTIRFFDGDSDITMTPVTRGPAAYVRVRICVRSDGVLRFFVDGNSVATSPGTVPSATLLLSARGTEQVSLGSERHLDDVLVTGVLDSDLP